MANIPEPGKIYRYFTGDLYRVVTLAKGSETKESMVVYQALCKEGEVYVEPLSLFREKVDKDKYPDAVQEYRFEVWKELVEVPTVEGLSKEIAPGRQQENTVMGTVADADNNAGTTTEADSNSTARMIIEAGSNSIAGMTIEANSNAGRITDVDSDAGATADVDAIAKMAADIDAKREVTQDNDNFTMVEESSESSFENIPEDVPIDISEGAMEEEINLDPLVLEFLDAKTYGQRLNILSALHHRITDDMIDIMALATDIEIEEGDVEQRFDELRTCLLTFEKYECNRLR